jgi:hypothetical protein
MLWPKKARKREGSMATHVTPIEMQDGSAMRIVAKQRQQLHEKILRLRALREASEANTAKDKNPKKNMPSSMPT